MKFIIKKIFRQNLYFINIKLKGGEIGENNKKIWLCFSNYVKPSKNTNEAFKIIINIYNFCKKNKLFKNINEIFIFFYKNINIFLFIFFCFNYKISIFIYNI